MSSTVPRQQKQLYSPSAEVQHYPHYENMSGRQRASAADTTTTTNNTDSSSTTTRVTTTTTTTTADAQQQQQQQQQLPNPHQVSRNSSDEAYGTLYPDAAVASSGPGPLGDVDEYDGDPDLMLEDSSAGDVDGQTDSGGEDGYSRGESESSGGGRSFTHPVTFGGLLMVIPLITSQVRRWSLRAPMMEVETVTYRTTTTNSSSNTASSSSSSSSFSSHAVAASSSSSAAATVSTGTMGRVPLHGTANVFLGWLKLPSLEQTRSAVQNRMSSAKSASASASSSSAFSSSSSSSSAAAAVTTEVIGQSTRLEAGGAVTNVLPLPVLIGGLSLVAIGIARYVVRPSLPSVRDYHNSRIEDETARIAATAGGGVHAGAGGHDLSGYHAPVEIQTGHHRSPPGEHHWHTGTGNDNDASMGGPVDSSYTTTADVPQCNPTRYLSEQLPPAPHLDELSGLHQQPSMQSAAYDQDGSGQLQHQQHHQPAQDSGRITASGRTHSSDRLNLPLDTAMAGGDNDIHTSRSPVRLPPLRTQQHPPATQNNNARRR